MTRGMGVGGMETTFAREGHAFRAGIREGERRAYWLVAIGALCAMEQAEHEESVAGYATQDGDAAKLMVHGLWFTFAAEKQMEREIEEAKR